MHVLNGTVASPGIVIGPAYLFVKERVRVERIRITQEEISIQQKRLLDAFSVYRLELSEREAENAQERDVIGVHIEILSDPYFMDTVSSKIQSMLVSADWALQETVNEMAAMIASLEDPYFRERATDYRDIGLHLLYAMKGIQARDLSRLPSDCIVLSDELTPADISTMDRAHVLGLVDDLGGKTSHTSIIAQTLGIPALVGMREASEQVRHGQLLILDAEEGRLIVDPDEQCLEQYREKIRRLKLETERLNSIKDEPAKTVDGRSVDVSCNIGSLEDLDVGMAQGADCVGLFRTEFLYMNNTHFPTEEEQFNVYREAVRRLKGRKLIIRTLDIGGDKVLSYYDFPPEKNPFLGWRALRICYDHPELLKRQLRAILRAGLFGPISLLLPMVISVEDILWVRGQIEKVQEELRERGLPFAEQLELGVMIETPASVFLCEQLIRHCDFFSVGTNDLTQYILAVDRGNERITGLFNTFHPAVLRAIQQVIDASHRAGKWTGLCGGFSAEPTATYLLLGMGLDEFSCPASVIPRIKDRILSSRYDEAKIFAQKVLQQETLKEVEVLIQSNEQSTTHSG